MTSEADPRQPTVRSTQTSRARSAVAVSSPEPSQPPIEIGWVLAGRVDPVDAEAIEHARQHVLDTIRATLPGFTWTMPVVHRAELVEGAEVEPTALLDHALTERNLQGWDFTFVVTGAGLTSYQKPFALAVVSRALDAAVLSSSRIDPRTVDPVAADEDRIRQMSDRLATLALHSLGHLGGLSHASASRNYMHDVQAVEDLDTMREWSAAQRDSLSHSLQEVADLRLEEQRPFHGRGALAFYVRSFWINRREIATAVLNAKPWQFPLRLSRLTVAALSTMLIMLFTAEAWDLGSSQNVMMIAGLPGIAVGVTTLYVLARQRLLLRRYTPRLSEQTVMTNLSTVAIVAGGMATAWLLTFGIAVTLTIVLFDHELVARWAASIDGPVHRGHYLSLAVFVASLGLGIGAIGASFEGQHYFRHVTFVDEEV